MANRTQVNYRYKKYDSNGRPQGGGGSCVILNGIYDHFEALNVLEARYPEYVIEITSIKEI
ncbi:MAG: hypothetical protein MJ033_01030 [Victivallaceae bacterium]|nr:hypothetical protein [Victivallaceae bacterium]